jgi:hypothetical protein
MSNFLQIFDLPELDLYNDYVRLLSENKIFFKEKNPNQICLNSTVDHPDDLHLGAGSLFYDWQETINDSGALTYTTVKRENPIKEEHFQILNSQFKGSLFEEVYIALQKKYKLGRVRIMRSNPKTCLSWHVDSSIRIHYPIKTQEGCFMVIDKEVVHLSQNKWWWTNTKLPHTAFNSSKEVRIHLVVECIEND